MRTVPIGRKWLGVQALTLLRDRSIDVAGIVAPQDDRLADAACGVLIGIEEVPALRPDLILCAHAHLYIPEAAIEAARLGAIGYHPSLLPLHRGRDAVAWTVRMGDRIAGGSVYWLDGGVDTGPIAAQDWCFVRPGDTPRSLWRRDLAPMGARLLGQVLDEIAAGRAERRPQDPALATWEPGLTPPPLGKRRRHRRKLPRLQKCRETSDPPRGEC